MKIGAGSILRIDLHGLIEVVESQIVLFLGPVENGPAGKDLAFGGVESNGLAVIRDMRDPDRQSIR